MNEYDVLIAEHEVLMESGDWGFDTENNNYYHYVEGVVDLAEKLLKKQSLQES